MRVRVDNIKARRTQPRGVDHVIRHCGDGVGASEERWVKLMSKSLVRDRYVGNSVPSGVQTTRPGTAVIAMVEAS